MGSIKPNLTTGTIGHLNHGKSNLTHAITLMLSKSNRAEVLNNYQLNNRPEERERGISMEPSVVEYTTDKYHYSHVDCPGHQDYYSNLIRGVSLLDTAILVVSCSDGQMPGTRHCIHLLKYLGIKSIVIAMINPDRVEDEEIRTLIKDEIHELIVNLNFFNKYNPFLEVNTIAAIDCGCGKMSCSSCGSVLKLLDTMDEHFIIPERNNSAPLFIPVFRVHNIKDKGVIVIGKIETGTVKIGDVVEIKGPLEAIKTVVLEIENFKRPLTKAFAGDIIGLRLRGIDPGVIKSGDIIICPGSLENINKFITKLTTVNDDPWGYRFFINNTEIFKKRNNVEVQLHFFTSKVNGLLIIKDKKVAKIERNKEIKMEITLDKPRALKAGQKYVLTFHNEVIGGGKIEEIIS